jgi:hypothetical protein
VIPVARSTPTPRLGTLVAVLLLAVSVAGPAEASPETLTRSLTNIFFGPLDMALGPVVGTRAVYNNIRDIDDSTGVRVAYAIPGVVWNSMMCMSGGLLRTFTGAIELLPGLALLPLEADLDPIFAPPERSDALIDEEFDWGVIKIGINYVD